MIDPGCSTPTTSPGNGPGIPGLEAALPCVWPSAAAPAIAAYRKRSRRGICTRVLYSRRESFQAYLMDILSSDEHIGFGWRKASVGTVLGMFWSAGEIAGTRASEPSKPSRPGLHRIAATWI